MDKPSSMSVKEHIYRKLSLEDNIPYATVKKVIDYQFRTVLAALKDINVNSLEIAGFGKIHLNKKRLWVEIRKMRYLLALYSKMLLIEDLTLIEIKTIKKNILLVQSNLEVFSERAVILKVEVPIEKNLSEKIRISVNKKIRERNEYKKKG